jgi:hypothetical protein
MGTGMLVSGRYNFDDARPSCVPILAPVFVYNLVTAGSVEERMSGLQQRKRELAQSVLAQPSAVDPVLGECEVEQLFAPLTDEQCCFLQFVRQQSIEGRLTI